MNISIKPTKLSGSVVAVPSETEAHIKLICAMFSCGKVHNVPFTEDVCCTLDAIKELGADFDLVPGSVIFKKFDLNHTPVIDCGESIKTLIYFMCVCSTCSGKMKTTFTGSDMLSLDIVSELISIMSEHGVKSDFNGKFPFTISGSLGSGEYSVSNKHAEELVSGLLLSLSYNKSDSLIAVTGGAYPKSGIELTMDVLRESKIMAANAGDIYIVRGDQDYCLFDTEISGDFSLASNFVVANFLNSNVRVSGLDAMSAQPEKVIFDILRKIQSTGNKPFNLDCREFTNLVPILAVYACSIHGKSYLRCVNKGPSDKTVNSEYICEMINSVGGKATVIGDKIEIEGGRNLGGGVIDCHFEHRIVYAAAVLSILCSDTVIIKNAECVAKPYASFFDDFRRVGGNASIIME